MKINDTKIIFSMQIKALFLFKMLINSVVRVQDRLIYFPNMFGAFSANTVRGLLYMKLVDLLFSYSLHRPPWLLC